MSFLETVRRARDTLQEHQRVSFRALQREFELDNRALEELIDELVDIQQVARRNGKALEWAGPTEASTAQFPTPNTPTTNNLPSEAERRQLTVLFCDLVDSTRLAAGLDPEDWREVIRAWQESCRAVVERFAGHVARYLGDGLLVYFGWPRAHEDDAERAVRAGLGILEAMTALNARLHEERRPELAVRIGVHTGPVVAGELGDETQVLGHTMNLASRLEGEAAADTLVVSSATLRLVQGIFVTEDLGTRTVKGVTEPVRLHRVVRPSGMRSRLDVAAATGLTPLVGRDQELGVLEDRFAQITEGLGQALLISGEAGIGKSRLVQTFRERIAERAHTWLECRCSPYTQDSAFYPVLELQRQGLGLGAEVPTELRIERLEAGLGGAGFEVAQAMPLMAGFHGLALPARYQEPVLSPEGRRKQTLELLVEWLLRVARLQPLVLLIEDLHWVDPSTQELLGQIVERIAREPVLLVATYRPDFEAPWGPTSHLTPMLLARLTRSQLDDLVRKAAHGRDLPERWVEEIVRRSDGVPLFAEELTKTVLESHPSPPADGEVPELHIPESLQDSLMARLDALGAVKELAQVGSVLGREFGYGLLLAVSPMKENELQRGLAAAVREELFYQRGAPPDATYLFKHALIRDAAYQSLLRSTRQRHHLRVADTLIERMLEVSNAQPELVAHHLTEAGETERAIHYWQRAGERAHEQVANEEAIRHLRRGLQLLGALPSELVGAERELDLQLVLARALTAARGYAHPETVRALERAQELADRGTEISTKVAVHYAIGNALLSAGPPANGLDQFELLRALAEEADDELYLLASHYGIGAASWMLGRFAASCEHLARAVALYRPDLQRFREAGFNEDPGLFATCFEAWALWYAGFPQRARQASERGIETAKRLGDPYSLALALAWAATTELLRRDASRARGLGDETVRVASEQGFPLFEAIGWMVQSWIEGLEGGHPDAAEHYAAAIAQAAATGNQGGAPQIMQYLAEIHFAQGRCAEAANTVETALAVAQQTGQPLRDADLHRLKGELVLTMESHTEREAEEEFLCALEIARGQEAKSLELRAATSLARLWRDQGKRDEARDVLAPVYAWFTEGFDTLDLKDAKALLEEME